MLTSIRLSGGRHEEISAQTTIDLHVSLILWLITAILTQSGRQNCKLLTNNQLSAQIFSCQPCSYTVPMIVYTASQLISRLHLAAEILHLQRSMLAADLCQARAVSFYCIKHFYIKISTVDDTEAHDLLMSKHYTVTLNTYEKLPLHISLRKARKAIYTLQLVYIPLQ